MNVCTLILLVSFPIFEVSSWDTLDVEIRYEDCPQKSWALCMCVNSLCHSIGDMASQTTYVVGGTIINYYSTVYDLSEYNRVTWNGHTCHGRQFTTIVRHQCWKPPGFLETISYDGSACKAVVLAHRKEACDLLNNLSSVVLSSSSPRGKNPGPFYGLDNNEASWS
jgi:hypothetical protein